MMGQDNFFYIVNSLSIAGICKILKTLSEIRRAAAETKFVLWPNIWKQELI